MSAGAVSIDRRHGSNVRKESIHSRIPEMNAAGEAGFVGDERHLGRKLERQLARVASAEIEVIVVEERMDDIDDPLYAPVPAGHALGVERGPADILVVGLVLPNGMLSKLKMRHEFALAIERAAE